MEPLGRDCSSQPNGQVGGPLKAAGEPEKKRVRQHQYGEMGTRRKLEKSGRETSWTPVALQDDRRKGGGEDTEVRDDSLKKREESEKRAQVWTTTSAPTKYGGKKRLLEPLYGGEKNSTLRWE